MTQLSLLDILKLLEDNPNTTIEDAVDQLSNPKQDTDVDELSSDIPLLEHVINNFLHKCIDNDRFPTLQEAQTIHVFDEILRKHND